MGVAVKIKLVGNWAELVKKAWSLRLSILASLLTALSMALPMLTVEGYENVIALGTFLSQLGAGISAAGAAVSRVVDQGLAKPKAADEEPLGV